MSSKKPSAIAAICGTLRGPPGTFCRSWVHGYTLSGCVCSLPMIPVAQLACPSCFGIDGIVAAV